MTPSDITRWANSATIGESVVYAVGAEWLIPSSNSMRAARQLYQAGLVTLVQRRLPSGMFEYVAQRINGKPVLAKDCCVRCGTRLSPNASGDRCRKCQGK
jgi:ribosomal protein L40E